ncbi:MAG: hypothetical protein H6718_05085 [Polyangiaceae bacterium]|nr:hypothetical protein [Polyangiaceae bacterium]MCB9607681.1 hypothetical protein [Polyangiaceae bacterium]
MVLFEVYLTPGANADELFTQETLDETGAKVMTLAQAEQSGLSGFKPAEHPGELRLVMCDDREARFVHMRLEGSGIVSSFRGHEIAG